MQRESGGSRKRKGKKDPNAPKRPQSAYFIWLNEHREQIKTDNPGITITEISKKAGQMWGEVSDKTVCSLASFLYGLPTIYIEKPTLANFQT